MTDDRTQDQIDAERKEMVDEIIDGLRIKTVDEGIRAAKAWCTTAAQEASNAGYWQGEVAARDATIRQMREALGVIQAWDMLNPPRPEVLADLPWLRRLVDAALAEQTQPTWEPCARCGKPWAAHIMETMPPQHADCIGFECATDHDASDTVCPLAIEAQEEADLDEGTRKRGPMTDMEQKTWGAYFDGAMASVREALGLPPHPTPSPAVESPAVDGRKWGVWILFRAPTWLKTGDVPGREVPWSGTESDARRESWAHEARTGYHCEARPLPAADREGE